jgi:hypothetical protein
VCRPDGIGEGRYASGKNEGGAVKRTTTGSYSDTRCRTTAAMADLIFIAIAVGFFALCALYVKGCQRLIGDTDDLGEIDESGH